jgi:hypothetical protein
VGVVVGAAVVAAAGNIDDTPRAAAARTDCNLKDTNMDYSGLVLYDNCHHTDFTADLTIRIDKNEFLNYLMVVDR